jgi:hypothetical protein
VPAAVGTTAAAATEHTTLVSGFEMYAMAMRPTLAVPAGAFILGAFSCLLIARRVAAPAAAVAPEVDLAPETAA